MNPGLTILVSIATSLTTSIIAFLLYTPKLKADLQKEFTSRFNKQKWQAYTQFAGLLPRIVECERTTTSLHKVPDLLEQLTKMLGQIFIVGSPDVANAFIEWLSRFQNYTTQGGDYLPTGRALGALLIEMKKDLGYKPKTDISDFLTLLKGAND